MRSPGPHGDALAEMAAAWQRRVDEQRRAAEREDAAAEEAAQRDAETRAVLTARLAGRDALAEDLEHEFELDALKREAARTT